MLTAPLGALGITLTQNRLLERKIKEMDPLEVETSADPLKELSVIALADRSMAGLYEDRNKADYKQKLQRNVSAFF